MKKRILLVSFLTIALCFSLIFGATYALFTSESKVNIAVTSGKVKVEASLSNLQTYSMEKEQPAGKFENGGVANLEGGSVVLTNITPGDKATFKLTIENLSNIKVNYCVQYLVEGSLAEGLQITETENGQTTNVVTNLVPEWITVDAAKVLHEKEISILLPVTAGNEYQEKELSIKIVVYAVQANDPAWNGKADVAWYNDSESEFTINTAAELQGLSKLVNDGNTFAGKTVKLGADIDLASTFGVSEFTPIGNSKNSFKGTFDGQNHTISNLKLTANPKASNVGLFGVTENGEIKNLTVENATVKGRLNVAVVAGTPYTSKYTNITVKGLVKVDGMAYVGAVGGKNAYANWDNIVVDVEDGSYVNANSVENGVAYRTYVGGVIGFMGEGGHTVSNVKSNIDVFGSTCDVAGVVGIAHYQNQFENIECSGDVTIYGADDLDSALEIGGIAGVWNNGDNVTLTNVAYTGELSSTYFDENGTPVEVTNFSYDGLVGKAYSANGKGVLTVNGKEYVAKKAATVTELKEILNSAGDKGVTVDCGGANIGTLSYTNFKDGAVIKNAVMSGSNRWNNSYGDVTFIGCTFESSVYALNVDSGNGTISFIDCTFKGWSGIGAAISEVTFENCVFLGSGTYGLMRVYQNATFKNCYFDLSNTKSTDTYPDGLSAVNGAVVTLEGCTLVYCNYEVAGGAKIIVDGTVVAQ